MQVKHVKSAVVAAWVLGLAAVAVSGEVTSATGWMFLVGLGVLPPLVLLRMWHQPAQTMSESIREVLR